MSRSDPDNIVPIRSLYYVFACTAVFVATFLFYKTLHNLSAGWFFGIEHKTSISEIVFNSISRTMWGTGLAVLAAAACLAIIIWNENHRSKIKFSKTILFTPPILFLVSLFLLVIAVPGFVASADDSLYIVDSFESKTIIPYKAISLFQITEYLSPTVHGKRGGYCDIDFRLNIKSVFAAHSYENIISITGGDRFDLFNLYEDLKTKKVPLASAFITTDYCKGDNKRADYQEEAREYLNAE